MGNGKPTPAASMDLKAQAKLSEPTGSVVLQEVVQMTGLPEDYLNSEISSLLGAEAQPVNNMTLDQLRNVLMSYLESMNEVMMNEAAMGEGSENTSLTHELSKH